MARRLLSEAATLQEKNRPHAPYFLVASQLLQSVDSGIAYHSPRPSEEAARSTMVLQWGLLSPHASPFAHRPAQRSSPPTPNTLWMLLLLLLLLLCGVASFLADGAPELALQLCQVAACVPHHHGLLLNTFAVHLAVLLQYKEAGQPSRQRVTLVATGCRGDNRQLARRSAASPYARPSSAACLPQRLGSHTDTPTKSHRSLGTWGKRG